MTNTILDIALSKHRTLMKLPLHQSGRVTEFFMIRTLGAARVGLDPEALYRVLLLFPVWDDTVKTLESLGAAAQRRLFPLEIGTRESVLDESSGRIYSATLKISVGTGLYIPMRDAATGSASLDIRQTHEISRADLEDWQSAERQSVQRDIGCGYDPKTKRYADDSSGAQPASGT